MATATHPPEGVTEPAGYLYPPGAGWDLYRRLDDYYGERAGIKLVYARGDLWVMGKSRRHDGIARRAHDLVEALAEAAGAAWDDAGEATFRREGEAGSQGDEAFYFGARAQAAAGQGSTTPGADPLPDLVVEVEVGNRATGALLAWADLGVPEVWHVRADAEFPEVCLLRLGEGAYAETDRSGFLPVSAADLSDLLRSAAAEGRAAWKAALADRCRAVVARNR